MIFGLIFMVVAAAGFYGWKYKWVRITIFFVGPMLVMAVMMVAKLTSAVLRMALYIVGPIVGRTTSGQKVRAGTYYNPEFY